MSTNYTPNPNKDKNTLDSMDIENENNLSRPKKGCHN